MAKPISRTSGCRSHRACTPRMGNSGAHRSVTMKSRPASTCTSCSCNATVGSVVTVSGRSTTYAYSSNSSTLGR